MASMNQGTFEEGREAQFREMMERFAEIHSRYKGVRGELLAKVRDELLTLKPSKAEKSDKAEKAEKASAKATPPPAPAAPSAPAKLKVVTSPATSHMLPSCRSCGRSMKEAGDGTLVCQNGHVRQLAS
ncbi:MAG: hypothetical protein ACOZQL_18845 [Myxococcota bacterium]